MIERWRAELAYLIARASLRVYPDHPKSIDGWRHRASLRFLEWRYQVALRKGGREFARRFDYVPF